MSSNNNSQIEMADRDEDERKKVFSLVEDED